MNGVPTRCRSSHLMNALTIERSKQRLEKLKCDFFIRLNQNIYTKTILDNVFALNIKADLWKSAKQVKMIWCRHARFTMYYSLFI
ncbi:hypothetical protein BpHYR1_051292 [Brachionus plicatilis]|uniref:Uncharacterized protein n=1 Tax=Brachionus plicatilis TaxID=10195 RepID=A0A3M7P5S4_BRAPC|nr:hypothetical protein BpHYR1_051292 [Brachionus plicatilis]